MSVLFDLPEDLCRVLLNSWLALEDLGFLDSAVSNTFRKSFLHILPSLIIDDEFGVVSFFKWVQARRLRLTNLTFSGELWTSVEPLLPALDVSRVCAVELDMEDIDGIKLTMSLNTFLASCSCLTKLQMSAVHNLHLLDQSILRRLEHFHGRFGDQVLPALYDCLAFYCRSLTRVSLFFNEFASNDRTIEFLKYNPNIRDLTIWCDQSNLDAIFSLCPRLDSLFMKSKIINIAHMGKFLRQKPRMKCFRISSSTREGVLYRCKWGTSLELNCAFNGWNRGDVDSLLAAMSDIECISFDCWLAPYLYDWFRAWQKSLKTLRMTKRISSEVLSTLLLEHAYIYYYDLMSVTCSIFQLMINHGQNLRKVKLLADEPLGSYTELMSFLEACPLLTSVSLTFPVDKATIKEWEDRLILSAKHVKAVHLIISADEGALSLIYSYGVLNSQSLD